MSDQQVVQNNEEQTISSPNKDLPDGEAVKINEVPLEVVIGPTGFIDQFESPKAITKPLLVVDRSMPELAQLSQSNR